MAEVDHIDLALEGIKKWEKGLKHYHPGGDELLLASIAHSLVVIAAASVKEVLVDEIMPGAPGYGWIRTETGTPGGPDNKIVYTRRES